MDTSGIEPEAFSMRTKRDTTTPYTQVNYFDKKIHINYHDKNNFILNTLNKYCSNVKLLVIFLQKEMFLVNSFLVKFS